MQYKLTFLSSSLRSREDRSGTRKVCKEMMAENFTNLVKAINLKAKAELNVLKDKLKGIQDTLSLDLWKLKTKKNFSKVTTEKQDINCRGPTNLNDSRPLIWNFWKPEGRTWPFSSFERKMLTRNSWWKQTSRMRKNKRHSQTKEN